MSNNITVTIGQRINNKVVSVRENANVVVRSYSSGSGTTYDLFTEANGESGNVILMAANGAKDHVQIVGNGSVNVSSNGTSIIVTGVGGSGPGTTYDLSLGAANTSIANIQLVGSDLTTDTIHITGDGAVNVQSNTTHIVVSAPIVTDTDTTYTLNVLANTTAGSNVRLTSDGNINNDIRFVGTGIANIQSNTTAIIVNVPAPPADVDTTYSVSAVAATGGANVRLTSSTNANDDVRLANGAGITITATNANTITIASTITDTDTTYTLGYTQNTTSANVRLTSSGNANTDVKIVGTGIATVNSNSTVIAVNVPAPVDLNTTYDLQLGGANNTVANVNLVGSDASTDTIRVTGNGAVNVISNATHVIVSAPVVTDTDTTYSQSVVANTLGANVRLTSSGSANDDITFANGTGITIAATNSNTITISSTIINTDTTYNISAVTGASGANVRLTSSGNANDDVRLANGAGITITATDANTITITSTVTDTDTTYSQSVVANTLGANVRLTSSGNANDDITFANGAGITITATNANTLTIATTVVDTDTKYDLATGGANTSVANLNLVGTDATTDTVRFTGNGSVNVISNATHIVVSAPVVMDTDTTYTVSAVSTTGGANVRLTSSGNANDDVKFTGTGTVTVSFTDANTITIDGAAAAAAPGGTNTNIQYNDSGALQGATGFTFDETTNNVTLANTFTAAIINATSDVNVGANVDLSTTRLFIGNTTANATVNSVIAQITNSTSTANITPAGLVVGTTTANGTVVQAANVNSTGNVNGVSVTATTSANVGANVSLSTSRLFVGNATANATVLSTQIQVANSTNTITITPISVAVGATIANTTAVAVGANVIANTSAVLIGNSTVNTIINSTSVRLANSTVNTQITVPSSVQYAATNAFLHANGSWVQPTDNDTTYSQSVIANTLGANVRLTASTNANDDITFANGTGITITATNANTLTIATTVVDTDTKYDLTTGGANTTVANLNLVGTDATTDTVRFTGNGSVNVIANATHVIVSAPLVTDTDTTYTISSLTATGGANVRLTSSGNANDDIRIASGTGITVTSTDSNTITIASTVTDTDTTYTQSVVANTLGANVRLTASTNANDDITFANGAGITITATNSNTITITSTVTDTTYTLATLANTTAGSNVRLTSSGNVNTEVKLVGSGTVNVQSNSTTIIIDGAAAAASPGGANTQVQYNDSGVLGGSAGFVFNETTNNVTIANTLAASIITASTSANIGANVNISTSTISVGNATVNTVINSSSVAINGVNAALISQRDSVANNGTLIGTRGRINFIQGTNVTLNISDDSSGGQVNVTINSTDTTTPGGANTQIQYNDSGTLNGSAGFTFDETTNNVSVANTLTTANIGLGANVNLNTVRLSVGNTTANATVNSIITQVANSTSTANITPIGFAVGTTVANSIGVQAANVASTGNISGLNVIANTTIAVGANVTANTTARFIGNSTVNTVHTQTSVALANSTIASNLQTGQLNVGANSNINAIAHFVGNSTVNAIHTQTSFVVANSTVQSNVQIGVVNIGNSTVNVVANSSSVSINGANATTINNRDSVANNGTLIGTRSRINFIQGTNITLTVSDDSAGNQVNVQIAASGGGGGGGSPGGSNTQIQYNDSGAFNGTAAFTFNETTNVVSIANSLIVGNSTTNVTVSPTSFVLQNSSANLNVNASHFILKASNPRFIMQTAGAPSNRLLVGAADDGSYRWSMDFGDATAESGNNVGSGFAINRYSDVGAYVSTPLFITRDTGKVYFQGFAPAAPTPTFADELTRKDYVDGLVDARAPKGPITSSNLTMATARILGRSTAGTGNVEEISVGSGLSLSGGTLSATGGGGGGSPGGSNTHVQFNNSGSFGGNAAFTFDTTTNTTTIANTLIVGNTSLYVEVSNARIEMASREADTPIANANSIIVFARNAGGRQMPAFVGPSGLDSILQPSFSRNRVAMVVPNPQATTLSVFGIVTANTLALVSRAPASTNAFLSFRRGGIATNTTAGTSAGLRGNGTHFWRGNAAGLGGFHFVARFGVAIVAADMRAFIGFKNSTAVFANSNPSAQTNIIGIGFDSTQTTWRIMSNAGSGTAPTIDLGAEFPTNVGNTHVYELAMFAPPNATFVRYQVTNLTSSNTVFGEITANSTNMPSTTTFLAPHFWINNGATAAAAALDIIGLYIETDT